MKIVIDKDIPGLAEGIRELWPDREVAALEGRKISKADVSDADALIVRTRTRCDAALLSGSRVKLVGSATIGTDHIDTRWCAEAGIRVVNAPGCNADGVVQYVAATLAAAGFDPSRHTLGIIGKGSIGGRVARLYRGVGANVLVNDPPRAEAGMDDDEYLPLEEVLSRSDAVTLHVPYTLDGPHPTRHLLREKLPAGIKILVNASRGSVVDPGLLLAGGGERRLIIDTWPFEDYPEEFTDARRREMIAGAFIATPHIAGYTVEGKRRATEAMLEALGAPRRETAAPAPPKTPGEAAAGFNPILLSDTLKKAPEEFENLRTLR